MMQQPTYTKPVEHIWTDSETKVSPLNDEKMIFAEYYMGDRSDQWVLIVNKEGEELERFNVKQLSSIRWLKNDQ